MYMFAWYPTMQMYAYYVGMFGAAEATRLVDIFALIYGIIGAVATIFAGRLIDWVGLAKSAIFVNLLNLVAAAAFLIPTVASQIFFQVCLSVSMNLFFIFMYRFCMLYAPVQLFGTYTGVIMLIMGAFQMGFSACASYLKGRVVHASPVIGRTNPEVVFVQSLTSAFFIISVVLLTMLVIYWQKYPAPSAGSVTCRQAGIPEESEYEALDPNSESEDSWL